MAKPWVHAIDRIAGHVPPNERLDSVEKDGLELSTAAVMYQHGGSLDARVLLLSCVAGIALPRVLKYLEQREQERKNGLPAGPDKALNAQLEAVKAELAALKAKSAANDNREERLQ
jgi:hypothetical protein